MLKRREKNNKIEVLQLKKEEDRRIEGEEKRL